MEELVERAGMYFENGIIDRAIADCTEAIRLDPNFSFAYEMRGAFHYTIKNFYMAIADYTETIKLGPNIKGDNYYMRGIVYCSIANYHMAVADFTEAIRLSPDAYYYYICRGLTYERMGEKNRANSDYQTALKLNSYSAKYRNEMKLLLGW